VIVQKANLEPGHRLFIIIRFPGVNNGWEDQSPPLAAIPLVSSNTLMPEFDVLSKLMTCRATFCRALSIFHDLHFPLERRRFGFPAH
jgi:hypothetical protein